MKTFLLYLSVAVLCFSCQQQPSYTIKGRVAKPGLEGKEIYLTIGGWTSGKEAWIDTAVITNNSYTFRGYTEELQYANISVHIGDREEWIYGFVVLENAELAADIDTEGELIVSGTAFNNEYQQYRTARKGSDRKWTAAFEAFRAGKTAGTLTPEEEQRLSGEIEKWRSESEAITLDFVRNHINNPGAWTELQRTAIFLPAEQQRALIAPANERTLQTNEVKEIQERIRVLEKTAIGQPYIDLRMSAPDGKTVALSDFVGKGKWVLVDFWASWCGPCRGEMPNVRAAYEQYKDRGLEIVGISLDSKQEAWVKAIEELQLPWPQMSDLKGWECEGVKAYGFAGIPHTILLDPDGKVVARNLHGEGLHQQLAEVLK